MALLYMRLLFAGGIILLAYLGSYIGTFILNKLSHIASKTKITLDDEVILSLKLPTRILFILGGLFGANYYLDPDLMIGTFPMLQVYFIIGILFVSFTLSRIISASLKWYGRTVSPRFKGKEAHDTLFPFVRKLIAWIIYLIAFMIILRKLGIEVGPLLAGLGVAGLAVALALQDTLTNFFAGISILSDKPIKVGDYIKLESSIGGNALEGFVKEVGWRTTRIESGLLNPGFTIVIPNSKIAQSNVVNYSIPQESSLINIKINVGYNSDVKLVKDLLIESVKNVSKINEHLSKDSEPSVLINNFGTSSLEFSVVYRIDHYANNGGASTEIREEILKLFKKNKVDIPFPITTVELKK
jgi:small-conductance mechanosensitive channel